MPSPGEVLGTSEEEEEKKKRYTSSIQLRADQAPHPPWGHRLIYTD